MAKIKKNKLNKLEAGNHFKIDKIKKAKSKNLKTIAVENEKKDENIIELPPVRRSDEIPLSLVKY